MGLIGRGFHFQVPHHCPTHVITAHTVQRAISHWKMQWFKSGFVATA